MIGENDIPTAIKKLKLAYAFRGYNPGVLDCYESSMDERVMIIDDEDCTHITTNENDIHRCCFCLNPNQHVLTILPLDKKLIKQRVGGMADGAAFDESKFAFLEFKDQAQGNTPVAVEETYIKAASQLSSALNLFIEKLEDEKTAIEFTKITNVVCHIIVSEKFPRASALEQNMMLTFAMANNGVGLNFEKEILFNDSSGRNGK